MVLHTWLKWLGRKNIFNKICITKSQAYGLIFFLKSKTETYTFPIATNIRTEGKISSSEIVNPSINSLNNK
ncbi:hypothetical protein [Elizabethkingia miricola]|uniref:hypothetical protein n=1 Tax=Elizabethkingia miricola TaxID=172045 RepID=UPI000B35B347|nr:hypothetical protein [Elizabethkingia miricola]